jgi:hypothetical protein
MIITGQGEGMNKRNRSELGQSKECEEHEEEKDGGEKKRQRWGVYICAQRIAS